MRIAPSTIALGCIATTHPAPHATVKHPRIYSSRIVLAAPLTASRSCHRILRSSGQIRMIHDRDNSAALLRSTGDISSRLVIQPRIGATWGGRSGTHHERGTRTQSTHPNSVGAGARRAIHL